MPKERLFHHYPYYTQSSCSHRLSVLNNPSQLKKTKKEKKNIFCCFSPKYTLQSQLRILCVVSRLFIPGHFRVALASGTLFSIDFISICTYAMQGNTYGACNAVLLDSIWYLHSSDKNQFLRRGGMEFQAFR